MGRRYPGSLLARVLINKYYALQRKYRRQSSNPGRLDGAKAWFFKWEGAVVGGLFLSGVAALGVKLYVIERLDDIERRHERRLFYEGSCMMVGAHLAAIQNSLLFWQSLVAESEYQHRLRQPWQQQQQLRTQIAAQQMQSWFDVSCKLCGAGWKAVAEQQQQPRQQKPAEQPTDSVGQTAGAQGQKQQHLSEQQLQQQGRGVHQDPQQQQQQQQECVHGGRLDSTEVLQGQHQPDNLAQLAKQQQEQQQQVHELQSVQMQQQQQVEQQQQQSCQVIHPEHLYQWQQQQKTASLQQQRRWNPFCWYAQRQLQSAQQQLLQQQQHLALQQVGLQLWEDVHCISLKQVQLLQQQQLQQQELLMSHAQQLQLWQSLPTRNTSWLNLGFYSPDPSEGWVMIKGFVDDWWADSTTPEQQQQQAGVFSWLTDLVPPSTSTDSCSHSQQQQQQVQVQAGQQRQQQGDHQYHHPHQQQVKHVQDAQQQQHGLFSRLTTWLGGRAGQVSAASQHQQQVWQAQPAQQQQQQQQQGQQQEVPIAGWLRLLLNSLLRMGSRQQQQQQLATDQAVGVTAAPTAAAAADRQAKVYWHVSVRLWVPHWVPDSVEELDYELTSKEYVHETLAAAAVDEPDLSDCAP